MGGGLSDSAFTANFPSYRLNGKRPTQALLKALGVEGPPAFTSEEVTTTENAAG